MALAPPFCPGCVLVGADDTAVYMVQFPVQLTFSIGLLLQDGEDALPQAVFSPAIEATRDGLPVAVAFW